MRDLTYLYSCKSDGLSQQWQDRSADDYIYQRSQLEELCFFQLMMHCRKRYTKKESNQDSDDEESDDDNSEEFKFKEGHPGHEKMRIWKTPIALIPKGKNCHVAYLKILSDYRSGDLKEK